MVMDCKKAADTGQYFFHTLFNIVSVISVELNDYEL
jgi:hypothetical protein